MAAAASREEKKTQKSDLTAAELMEKLQTGISSFFTSAVAMAQPENLE